MTCPDNTVALGIDLGASAVHAIGVSAEGFVSRFGVVEVTELDGLLSLLPPECVVAIDAPATPSRGMHQEDATLSPKFRTARCGEIALGLTRGYWVPWATPLEGGVFPGWMTVGFLVYDAVRRAGFRAIEVYPNSIFREYSGGQMPPKKGTVAGTTRREQILRSVGINVPALMMWTHDAMDAAAAALVARAARLGTAQEVTCGHDGSAIWLPPPP